MPGTSAAGAAPPAASRNAKRRAKRKQQRSDEDGSHMTAASPAVATEEPQEADSDVLYAAEPEPADEMSREFSAVFARYQPAADDVVDMAYRKGDVMYSDDEMESESDHEGQQQVQMSKRKLRRLQRMSVADLKQIVDRPELVEWGDVASADPCLLIYLRAYRNAVPVPLHWGNKHDYLHNKRGLAKQHYQLPTYIAETGIASMRDAITEADSEKTLKAKTRERVQPKLGRMDIDYQKLHDAFFRFQTKPPLSTYGETYYEGKETESKFRNRRPGDLTPTLKDALSIPPLAPPPWLITMQRFGPPPSYPHLRIPGLNAPIPEGAQWGFHPGGWGRPPLNDAGQPMYGDVFGEHIEQSALSGTDSAQHERWGELEPDVEEEEEEEEEEEDEEDEDEEAEEEEAEKAVEEESMQQDGIETPSGLETPSGFDSVATVPEGLETPDHIELRKNSSSKAADQGPPHPLYQVLPERKAGESGRGFMGSERLYDLPPDQRQ